MRGFVVSVTSPSWKPLTRFAAAAVVDVRAWDKTAVLVRQDVTRHLVGTGETLDAASWIPMDVDHPGFERFSL